MSNVSIMYPTAVRLCDYRLGVLRHSSHPQHVPHGEVLCYSSLNIASLYSNSHMAFPPVSASACFYQPWHCAPLSVEQGARHCNCSRRNREVADTVHFFRTDRASSTG
jgi:hypothetical protein